MGEVNGETGTDKRVAEDVDACADLLQIDANGLDRREHAAKFVADAREEIVEHIRGRNHRTLYGHLALEPVAEAAHVLVAAVQFDGVVVGKDHEIAADVGVAVEAAVRMEVTATFHGVVPAYLVGAHKVVPAQDGGMVRLAHVDGVGAARMGIDPAAGRIVRIMHVAALHDNLARTRTDAYGRIVSLPAEMGPMDAQPGLEEVHVHIASESREFAVADAHAGTLIDSDRSHSAASPEIDVLDDHMLRAFDRQGRVRGGVCERTPVLRRVSHPSVRTPLR